MAKVDSSGDGMLSFTEFEKLLELPEMVSVVMEGGGGAIRIFDILGRMLGKGSKRNLLASLRHGSGMHGAHFDGISSKRQTILVFNTPLLHLQDTQGLPCWSRCSGSFWRISPGWWLLNWSREFGYFDPLLCLPQLHLLILLIPNTWYPFTPQMRMIGEVLLVIGTKAQVRMTVEPEDPVRFQGRFIRMIGYPAKVDPWGG